MPSFLSCAGSCSLLFTMKAAGKGESRTEGAVEESVGGERTSPVPTSRRRGVGGADLFAVYLSPVRGRQVDCDRWVADPRSIQSKLDSV